MKPKTFLLITFLGLTMLFLLPSAAMAWGRTAHDYMCPKDYPIDCNFADSFEFRRTHSYGDINHLCLDNKEDCPARLLAKYYLKKYYMEGQEDKSLLGAAAHLMQDVVCPAHWYPTRKLFGRLFVPFAPGWVATIEEKADGYLSRQEKNWNIPIKYQGETININQAYLDAQKEFIENFLLQEPRESIESLEAQIKSRKFWHSLRDKKEIIWVVMIIVSLAFVYSIWQWKRKKKTIKNKIDLFELILWGLILVILTILLILIRLFY